ncbi:MAG TPA: DUF3866 family protein [Acidimicrobiales bacterium]|nr:DUF3866 family protein [Acidimicrobiales bacterium]
MPSFITTSVSAVLAERPGLQRIDLADGSRAVVLTDLTGPVTDGDEVVVNTTAVELGLGTGGWHVVHWNLSRREWRQAGSGHIMKLRYTSLQTDVGAAEEQAPAPDWPALGGRPAVVCGLHSQVGIVAAIIKDLEPAARVVYVMTDGAALPLALSDLTASLRATGTVDATVTAGHAFGGDHEAVNVPSALDVAVRLAGADVVVVGMGPGVVGTASDLGTTAVEAGPILDAASRLGAEPILAARASEADLRPRHRDLSHHSTSALRLAALPARVGHAAGTPLFDVPPPHRLETVVVPPVEEVLRRRSVPVTSMGRGPDDDPRFFATTAAAGVLAAQIHRGRATVRP